MCDKDDDTRTERVALFSGALFLFGLAFLFATDLFWPWVLVLLFLVAIPIMLIEEGWLGAWVLLQGALWGAGLALLITLGAVWPYILVLAGISTLIMAFAPPDDLEDRPIVFQRGKRKRKRVVPLPGSGEYLDDEPEMDFHDDDDDDDDLNEDEHTQHAASQRRSANRDRS
jgi:polyferredoxin